MAASSVYVLKGADWSRKQARIRELARQIPAHLLDWHTCEAARLSAEDLGRLVREQPVASPQRLVVIERAQRLSPSCVEALRHTLAQQRIAACLILLVDEPTKSAAVLQPLAAFAVAETYDTPAAPVDTFALVNAIARRDVAAALQALDDARRDGREPLEVVGMLVWQLQRWMTVARLMPLRLPPQRMEALSGMSGWQMERVQREAHSRSVEWLTVRLWDCFELDVAAKRGELSLVDHAVERLVITLCRPENGTRARRQPVAA